MRWGVGGVVGGGGGSVELSGEDAKMSIEKALLCAYGNGEKKKWMMG